MTVSSEKIGLDHVCLSCKMWWVRRRASLRAAEAFYMSRMSRLNHPVNKGQEAGSAGDTMDTIDLKKIYT